MSNTTVYILVGVSFIVNLIIILAFRAADSKERRLKNLNQQVKNFRSEVSSTMNRMSSTARDCEQNITSRIEHANTVQEHLAESIDLVLVHQKELDDLSDVCENYGNALKKLKVQTEQAENRLYAVQAEVRKIEAVHEYAAQFQKETERIMSQMNSIKADYVRLVASTEQDLKNAAQSQKEENNEMLNLFNQSLERSRAQFSDYIVQEKRTYENICREQEITAQNQLDSLGAHAGEIEKTVRDTEERLNSFVDNIKAQLDELELRKETIVRDIEEKSSRLESDRSSSLVAYENKRDSLFTEMDNRVEKVTEDLESAVRNTENTLEDKLRDKEEEVAASLESCSEKISGMEKAVENALLKLEEDKEKALMSFKEGVESLARDAAEAVSALEEKKNSLTEECSVELDGKKAELEESMKAFEDGKEKVNEDFTNLLDEKRELITAEFRGLDDRMMQYRERCLNTIGEAVETTQNDAMQVLQKIKAQGDDYLKTVARATGDSEKAYHILTETAHQKVREVEENLTDLRGRIKETEALIAGHMETLTKTKEEIWNLQQEEKSLQSDVDMLRQDKSRLQSDNERAKSDRINEEAALVRLKGQQKVVQEEKKAAAKASKPTFEEMDIVIGDEEEIDVSDDDV